VGLKILLSQNKKINELVTKVDPFIGIPLNSNKKESHAEYMVFEQGQTSEDDEHLMRFSSRNGTVKKESDERIIDRYVEKEPSSSQISISKMDHSNHTNSLHDSPLVETNDEEEHQSELHKAHLIQTLQAIQYIKSLPNDHSLDGKYVNFPPHPLFDTPEETKTIIFDLDETLVHWVDEPETDNPHVILQVTFPTGETVDAGINIRPYAIECLKEANKFFQVVVFTASHQSYADVVLDYLDPNHDLIQYRLYRESCIQTKEGVYIKDLRIIQNRLLENIWIIDNAVYSFGFQLDNGIPIIPFYDDPADEELHHLVFYMKCLSTLEDMRVQNQNAFQLSALDSTFIEKYLEEYYSKLREEVEEESEGGVKESPTLGCFEDDYSNSEI
jgi:Dullard-like phosphatase family protein